MLATNTRVGGHPEATVAMAVRTRAVKSTTDVMAPSLEVHTSLAPMNTVA